MAHRVDANQPDIVRALRQAGASVAITSDLGHGYPDLLVGFRPSVAWILAQPTPLRISLPMEIKTLRGRLTPEEADWHASWEGSVVVVRSVAEALVAIGVEAAVIGRLEAHHAQLRGR